MLRNFMSVVKVIILFSFSDRRKPLHYSERNVKNNLTDFILTLKNTPLFQNCTVYLYILNE